jgi:2,5-diketo-D-gluconate reductase B
VPISINQIEFNPLQQQRTLVQYCRERNIQVMGYSPLAKGAVLRSPEVRAVAAECGCTPAQAAIAWSLGRGAVTIPKATKPAHIDSNLEAVRLRLPDTALARLDTLHCDYRCTWDSRRVS